MAQKKNAPSLPDQTNLLKAQPFLPAAEAEASFARIAALTEELLAIPSPSGDTFACRDHVAKLCQELGLELRYTHKGGLYAVWEGEDNLRPGRVVTAHIDTLGGMVSEILPDGCLRFATIGGFAYGSVEGELCHIKTDLNGEYTGTVLPDKASVHIWSDVVRETPRLENNVCIRLDAAVSNPTDVEALGIRVGDFIYFEPRFALVGDGYIRARYLDNKVDVAILLETLRSLKARGLRPARNSYFLFSDFEEVGNGVYGLPENISEIAALDIGTVGGQHPSSERAVTIVAKDSRTPYPYDFRRELTDLCRKHGIEHRVDVHYRYGSDASVAALSGVDLRYTCFGPGVNATHHIERTHKLGCLATMALLEAWLLSE